jgi:hypothetical protein
MACPVQIAVANALGASGLAAMRRQRSVRGLYAAPSPNACSTFELDTWKLVPPHTTSSRPVHTLAAPPRGASGEAAIAAIRV